MVDHNPAGRASLSPLFQALLYTWPDFDMRKVDVVADVEDLCKLWKFVLGPSSSEISWRMDLRTQQNTTMFSPFRTTHTRKQPSIIEHFVANCTSQERDLLDSLSHYRVVHYILGGIGFLVRFKSHYYDPILDPCEQDQTIPDWDRKVKPFPDWYEKGCFDVFENERIDEQTPASVALAWCGISNDPENIVMQQIPRLYFTQTKHLHVPRFVAGHHHQPTVGEVCKLVNCADYMKNWERKQQENLMKFVSLVKNISEVASENCPKVCAAVLANGELRMETDESYAEILRNAHLPQSPVAGPEMPYGGREVIEHLWRTIGEDSLPDSWRG